ncbi:malto-oligosyltrehalose trehalohydrolase [Neorhizobium sp. P12A]|uniref:malto-oligosyltrehalose trehalohydrolase n=1 Tax=Neorhizobium sp. P12A TaxID=2268027 RepID=UPI0011EBB481|nr:malto-oligosyltrehalose trehalohydrolase [Neorhizobium sp. P12A]KAA0692578.1 malto-oligosyltrehalose trehalohydrolase [Neorhizobium sp. P12A]
MTSLNRNLAGIRAHWGPEIYDGDVIFRLWAPNEKEVRIRLDSQEFAMTAKEGGWFEHRCAKPPFGSEYQFILSDGLAVADPASRSQLSAVDGPSLLTVPDSYEWKTKWRGRPWEEAVICELHIGTFTPEGTFRAAMERLLHLAESGFTAIEIMPVAHFSGKRGWGYDGVLHYAPHPAYGTPDDMKAFIDAAHAHGIMVLLDVVYNHFGPEGNYLPRYAPAFFRADVQTPWGAAIDYGQEAVRRYFVGNALYWIGEFQLDGLRLDAIEQIYDSSPKHILTEIAERVLGAFPDREIHLVVEDQRNDTGVLARNAGGGVKTYTAEWNDDFHHVAHVIATGEVAGHYKTFSTDLAEKLAKSLAEGFIFPNRGAASASALSEPGNNAVLPPASFINFLQNHDQIGNRAFGERLLSLADDGMVEALTSIMLLSPQIPFLFMGEDFGETQPFFFFCDYPGELGEIVRKGRAAEAEGFGGIKDGKSLVDLPDPNAKSTFDRSKLQWQSVDTGHGQHWRRLVRNLLTLRQRYVVPVLKRGNVRAEILRAPDHVVAVSWTSGEHKLELRANLSSEMRAIPPLDGVVIFDNGSPSGKAQTAEGKLGPRAVAFAIDSAFANAG